MLRHHEHALTIEDVIEGTGSHTVTIPLHLVPGVEARSVAPGVVVLAAAGKEFALHWSSASAWTLEIVAARVSPSYGVVVPATRLLWRYAGALPVSLTMSLAPRAVDASAVAADAVDAAVPVAVLVRKS